MAPQRCSVNKESSGIPALFRIPWGGRTECDTPAGAAELGTRAGTLERGVGSGRWEGGLSWRPLLLPRLLGDLRRALGHGLAQQWQL